LREALFFAAEDHARYRDWLAEAANCGCAIDAKRRCSNRSWPGSGAMSVVCAQAARTNLNVWSRDRRAIQGSRAKRHVAASARVDDDSHEGIRCGSPRCVGQS